MPTSRVEFRGGALHGRTIDVEHQAFIPDLYLTVEGWPYLRVNVTGPGRAVAVPDVVMPGPCMWCHPEGRGPGSCSCVDACNSDRCGQIGPRRDPRRMDG
jgi:hypothetical protein